MAITFKDLAEKQQQINETQRQYRQGIRDAAKNLFDNYVSSLNLEKRTWKSLNGKEYPYIYVNEGSPEDLQVDLTEGSIFTIVTIADATPRTTVGYNVTIHIYVQDDALSIQVGDPENYYKNFYPVDSESKLSEVSEAIKDAVMMQMNEVSVGKKTTPSITG
ncbi:hypothetical protein RGI97_002803 [Serratia marcescens]